VGYPGISRLGTDTVKPRQPTKAGLGHEKRKTRGVALLNMKRKRKLSTRTK